MSIRVKGRQGIIAVHDILGALSPQLPTTFFVWYHLLALTVVGVVKLLRGSVMNRRARRIDFFGWSIIMFDYIFGAGLVLATVWAFYPALHTVTFDYAVTTAVLLVSFWQLYTVASAPVHRIDRAMQAPESSEEDDDTGSGRSERRSGMTRRKVDRDRDNELEMYRAVYGELKNG